jgi:hypothetical protein
LINTKDIIVATLLIGAGVREQHFVSFLLRLEWKRA